MTIYKTGKRKYYKYGTEPNATVVGSFAKIDKGVASGFSTSQYLKLPATFNPQNNPWEALFKVKINTLINGSQIILGQRNSGGYDFYVDVNTVRLSVGDTAFAGTTTLQENTTYWFKYIFTGDTYIVKSSTNGVDWVDEINAASTVTATPTSDDCRIGVWYNTYSSGLGNPFLGSIDLTQSYININGERWWSGDSYTKVGSWIDDGVVSGFTTANYLKLPKSFNPQTDAWEMQWKFRTGSDVSTTQNIVAGTSSSVANLAIYISSSALKTSLGSGGSSWFYGDKTISNITANTEYLVRLEFTGSAYIWFINNELVHTYESTSKVGDMSNGFFIGVSRAIKDLFLGSTDLNQSYIKINGKEWWHGTKAYEVNLDGEDIYQDWKQPVLTANGTMGGDSFAVAQSSSFNSQDFWKLFSDSTLEWHSAAGLPQWVSWYNPKPLKVTKLSFVGAPSGNIGNGIVQACNDNSSWTDIVSFSNTDSTGDFETDLFSNDKAYKYWRIYITSCYYYNSGNAYSLIAKGFNIAAQELVAVGSDTYDYSAVEPDKIKDLYKGTERKYYKYDYLNWTQPVLTSNTSDSSFVVSASSELDTSLAAWKSFDGVIDSNCWISASVDISEEAPQYYYIKTDTPLKISSISVTNRTGSYPHSVTKGVLQASVDGDSWIDIVQINNDTVSAGATWTINANETVGYKHHRIKITDYYLGGDSSKYVALGHLVITAQKAVGVELNVNGSDIYQDFVQPVLTANGTMGGDKFAVRGERTSSQPAYYAYDGNGSTYLQLWSLDANETFFYNPNPLKVSKLDFVYYPETWITSGEIYGSNDDSNYILLTTFSHSTNSGSVAVNNEVGYKYFKIKVLGANGSTGSQRVIADIYTLTITSQERVAVGGTIDDADYSFVPSKRIVAAYKTGKRKYYKDGVEVPVESITDFGRTAYYKNIVTTKYWKEITTEVEGDVLAYAAYYQSGDALTASHNYAKAPIGSDLTVYRSKTYLHTDWATGVNDVTAGKTSSNNTVWVSVSDEEARTGSAVFVRQYNKDIYAKGTISTTTVVEGTPEDYTYTTEEITPVQVSADDEYDFTEFVPSTQFDSSEIPTQLVYNLKYNLNSSSAYAKEGTVSGTNRFGTDTGATTSENLNQTSIFTFNTPAPAGKWTGSFQYYSQVNFSMNQVYWRLTYEDGTQEYAYGPTGLGDTAYGGGERATISISFTAKKPIKTVTVYAQGSGGGSGRYGGLEYIQMFFDGSKQ